MKHRPQHIQTIKGSASVKPATTARSRKWLKRGAWALAIYTVVGFLILPLVIRLIAVKQLGKELHREVTLEKVRLNPFALSLSIRGLKIKDPDAETLLAWDEVYVNFQLASFLGHAWVFDEVAVVNPYARVQLNKDYSLNFSDILAAHSSSNAPPEKAAAPAKSVAVNVRQLRIEGARVAVADLTPKKPFRRVIGPVKISLSDFHTDPNSRNPHLFTGSTDSGETFSWGGDFSLDPIKAEGELAVDNVALKNFAALYEDFVSFEIRDGVAGFHANYNFLMSQATNIAAVSNVSFTLRSFKLGTPGAAENLVELPEFSVAGVSGDALARSVEVGSVAVHGAELNLTRAKGAAFNLVAAAQANTNQSAPGGILLLMRSVTNAFAQLLNSTNLASATVRNVTVQDCAVTLRDDSLNRPARLRVDQINVSAKNISNRPDTNILAAVSLRWNTNGTFKTDLDASLNPLNADVRLQLDQIELAPLSPYLDSFVNLYVLGSKVGLDGTIRLRTELGQIPTVTFAGSTALDDLNLVGGDTSEDLLKWSSLHFDGITANLNPPGVTVTNITLKDVAARVVIETNKVINVLALVRTNAFGEVSATNEAATATAPTDSGGSAIKRAFSQVKSLLGMETNTATVGLPKVEINTVTVEHAELQFLDRSVTPPARASLQKVNGTIQNISTEEMRRAQIHFEMLAGGTGPIEVTGQLNPLRAKQATEVKLSLKNVKLNPADPYTGKFLGYRLTRGELNVEVEYTISASQLKGRNVIMLDQLTLGSKVASPDATKMPVKLGIALLKDSSGKIELNVPVEGNLDDPQFRLGPVIWHVIGNIFLKAITSPFSLLGSLVGGKGGEEMQFQQFAPGSTELDVAAHEKLATVAKALEARPELEVEIEGNIHPVLDGAALRRAKMELQLRTGYWQSLRAAAREKTTAAQVELAPEVRADLLIKAYRDLLKTNSAAANITVPATAVSETAQLSAKPARVSSEVPKGATHMLTGNAASAPVNPAAKSSLGGLTSGAAASNGQPTAEQMEQGVMSVFKISDDEFAALATARARQVQTNLVQELKVAAERVLVSDPGPGAYPTNGHRVNLQLR